MDYISIFGQLRRVKLGDGRMRFGVRAKRYGSVLSVLLVFCALVTPITAFAQSTGLDVASITKIADGTHNGRGTATLLNSENGYNPADDTADDGVVASGDVVSYDINIKIQAGRQRELWLVFDATNAPYLATEQIDSFRFDSAMAPVEEFTTFDGKKVLHLTIRRGAAGLLKKTLTLTARDTLGVAQSGNQLTVDFFTSNPLAGAQPESTFTTGDVTVISAPFADLTLDTNTTGPIVYNTNNLADGGQFVIMPQELHTEDYSKAGLIASTAWHTDINVGNLPAGTEYKLCPTRTDSASGRVLARAANVDKEDTVGCEALTAENGVIKDVRGVGPKTLWYKMPDTVKEVTAEYTISLDVKDDSFQVGDAKNVKDPGQGEPSTYDTSTYKLKLQDKDHNEISAGALRGRNILNNNYSTARWIYYPPGRASSDLYAPYDATKTIYESTNQNWATGNGYYSEKRRLIDRANGWKATPETQMYDLMAMNVGADIYDSAGVTVRHQINTGEMDADMRLLSYDSALPVVVLVTNDEATSFQDARPLDSNQFSVRWFDQEGQLIGEQNNPIANAAYGEVSFIDPNALTGAARFYVAWPVKSGSYNEKTCSVSPNAGLVSAETTPCQWFQNTSTVSFAKGSTSLPGNSSEQLQRTGTSDGYVVYPTKPTLSHNITGADTSNDSERHQLEWTIESIVGQAPRSDNYHDLTLNFTLSKDQDPETFEAKTPGWQCSRVNASRTFTCTYPANANLDFSNVTTGTLPPLVFSTKTIAYLTIATTDAIVESKVTVDQSSVRWDPVAGLDDKSTEGQPGSGVHKINTSNNLEAVITAVTPVEETQTPITWKAIASVGALDKDGIWSQTVMLPKRGDEARWSTPTCTTATQGAKCNAVDKDVAIGDDGYDKNGKYDKYGKSDFHGNYSLDSFRITSYTGKRTKIKLIMNDGQEIAVNDDDIQINHDYGGEILSKIPEGSSLDDVAAIALEGYGNALLSESKTDPVSATQVGFDITLRPSNNKVNDKYLMWLGPTWKKSADAQEANSSNSWPDLIETRLGELSGVVYEDNNRSASLDPEDETRYPDVWVQLKCTIAETGDIADDQCYKTWFEYHEESEESPSRGEILVTEMQTAADGSYSFTKVHGGDYVVTLPQLIRSNESGNSNVTSQTYQALQPKETYQALQPKENRFKKLMQAVQTESYGKTWLNSDIKVDASVPRAGVTDNVNFGFVRPNDDLALNKSLPEYDTDTGTVSWDVTVRNTGNTVIKDIDVYDRMDKQINNVKTQGQLAEQITGANALTAGNDPTKFGEIVATDNGVWLYSGNDRDGKPTSYQRVAGIAGSPVYVAGDQPAKQSIVCTSNGCWYINGSTKKATKLEGITGKIVNENQIQFVTNRAVIATTDGVWTVSTSGALTHIKDANGNYKPGEITSADSNDRDVYLVIGKRLYTITNNEMKPYVLIKHESNGEDFRKYENHILKVTIGQKTVYGWNLQILTDLIDTRTPAASDTTSQETRDKNLCHTFTSSPVVKCAKLWRAAGGTNTTSITGIPASGSAFGGLTKGKYLVSKDAHDVIEYRDLSSIRLVNQYSGAQKTVNIVATDRGYWIAQEYEESTGSSYAGVQVPGMFSLQQGEEIKSAIALGASNSGRTGFVLTNRRVLLISRSNVSSGADLCSAANSSCFEADLTNGQIVNYSYKMDLAANKLSVTRSQPSSLPGESIDGYPLKAFAVGTNAFIVTTAGLYKISGLDTTSPQVKMLASAGDSNFGVPLYANNSNVKLQQNNSINQDAVDKIIVYTTEGVVAVDASDAANVKLTTLQAGGVGLPYTEGSQATSEESNREFVTRQYSIDQLDPGAEATFKVSGTVSSKKDAYTVANQAWVTSPQTPRQNLYCDSACPEASPAPGFPKQVLYTGTDLSEQQKSVGSSTIKWKIGNVEQSDETHIKLNYENNDGKIIDGAARTATGTKDTEFLAAPTSAVADDLADMSYFGLPGNPDIRQKHLAGKAWYDANSDGLENEGEAAASGLHVNVFKIVSNQDKKISSDDLVTGSDGTWQLEVQETDSENASYYVIYSALPISYENKSWIPTTRGVSSDTEINSDADVAGFAGFMQTGNTISGTPASDTAEAAGSAHLLDIGLRPLNAGLVVSKGLRDTTSTSGNTGSTPDSVEVSGSKDSPLPAVAPQIKSDQIVLNQQTKIMPASSNRIVTGQADDATPAFTFEFVYNPEDPSVNLTKLRVADATRTGEAAVLQTRALHCAKDNTNNAVADADGSGTGIVQQIRCTNPEEVQLKPDGSGYKVVKVAGGVTQDVQLQAGEKIVGAFIFPFTKTNQVHENTITVKAVTAVKNEATVTYTDLVDTDAFKATYRASDVPISLQLTKADSEDHDRLLAGAKFKVFKYTGTEAPTENAMDSALSYVSLAETDRNGTVTVANLSQPGYYVFEETTAPWGYKPLGTRWWIRISWDSATQKATLACALNCTDGNSEWEDGTAEITKAVVGSTNDGPLKMKVYNERLVWILPHTGGPGILGLIGGGLALIFLSSWMYLRRYRRSHQ